MAESAFDLIVIGGGPGGYSAAIRAAKEGLRVLLCEGERVGGTCLNVGCIPTKYLLDKANALEKIRALTREGILREAGLFSFPKIQRGREAAVQKLVSGVEYLLRAGGVTVRRGFARLCAPGTVEVEGEKFTARSVIIATGSQPSALPIPGAEYALDSTAALCLTKIPRRLAVIGGGVIGLELASAYAAFGAQVTVLEYLPQLLPGEERAAADYLAGALKKKGIRVICGARAGKIERRGETYAIWYGSAGGSSQTANDTSVEADAVLMATGRKPRLTGVDEKELGIELGARGEIKTDAFMRTSLPGVYAVGDAAGGYQLAHAAYAEAETAVSHILGASAPLDESALPRCVYTIPAFAAVGLSSHAAQQQGRRTACGRFGYAANGMALAEGAEGMVHVVMDADTRETLGVQVVGECAPEMIAFAAMAVRERLKSCDWKRLIVAHPSLSEMLKEAALDCFGESVHSAGKK